MTGLRGTRDTGGLPGLVGAADPAAVFGDDEAEVHPQPAVGGTGVRPDVRPRLHDREFNLKRPKISLSLKEGRESLQEQSPPPTWPRLQPVASGNFSSREHVFGTL